MVTESICDYLFFSNKEKTENKKGWLKFSPRRTSREGVDFTLLKLSSKKSMNILDAKKKEKKKEKRKMKPRYEKDSNFIFALSDDSKAESKSDANRRKMKSDESFGITRAKLLDVCISVDSSGPNGAARPFSDS